MKLRIDVDLGREGANWVIPGPSTLYFMASGHFAPDYPYRYAIPDNLVRLIARVDQGSEEHARFLARIVHEDHPERERLPVGVIAQRLSEIILSLRDSDRLILLTNEFIDQQIERAIAGSFDEGDYDVSLSPKRNFMSDYFSRAISWSKKTGAVIVETTGRRFFDLGRNIVALQLPQKADAIIKDKRAFLGRIYKVPGGEAAKWFIGVSIAVGGLAHPVLGPIGVGIAFADP